MTDRKLVVEADGGSRGNPGVAGYGALVRDADTREVLAERAAPLGKQSNNVAEYTGLIEGLRAVVDHVPGALVTVRMDSKLVVEQMSGRWKIKHEDMKRLAAEARELAGAIRDAGGAVTYEWIPRAKNKDADKLSNDGMDGVTVVRDVWGSTVLGNDASDADTDDGVGESAGADPVLSAASEAPDAVVAPPVAPSSDAATSNGSAEETSARAQESQATSRDRRTPTRVLLVRHGVTDFTTGGKLDGRGGADPSLNSEGRDQADPVARAVRSLVGQGDVHVVTSSLARAVQTGAVIAEALGVTPEVDEAWDEQAFGEWDGLTFQEIHARDADALRALRLDPTYRAPGGESRAELDERVSAALDRAAVREGTVVVVSHRIAIMSTLSRVLGLDAEGGWRLAAAPASLTGLEMWQNGHAQVAFTNDTHHLRG